MALDSFSQNRAAAGLLEPGHRRALANDQMDAARARDQGIVASQYKMDHAADPSANWRMDADGLVDAPSPAKPGYDYAAWASKFPVPAAGGVSRMPAGYAPPPPSSYYDVGAAQPGDNDWLAAKTAPPRAAQPSPAWGQTALETSTTPATHTQWDRRPAPTPGGVSYGPVTTASSGELQRRGLPASSGTAKPFGEPWQK